MTTQKQTHTPTPWIVNGGVTQENGQWAVTVEATKTYGNIADVWGENNARFIVKAVNEHAALCAVAEAAERLSKMLHDMTTADFSKGYDKPEREALARHLSQLATIRKG